MMTNEQRMTGAIRELPPCAGCIERFHACWDHCPKDERGEFGYKAWKGEIKRINKTRVEYLKRNTKKYIHYGGNEDG